MRETIGPGIYLEKFAADGTPEPDNRSKFFRVVQAVAFGQRGQRKRLREN